MRSRSAPAAAATLLATLALAALATTLAAQRGASVHGVPPNHAIDYITLWAFASLAVLGLLVAVLKPGNILWLLASGTAFCNALATATFEYAIFAIYRHPGAAGGGLATWLAVWTWLPTTITAPLVLLTYPTGRLLSRQWRTVVGAMLAYFVAETLITAFVPVAYTSGSAGGGPNIVNPLGISWLDGFGRNLEVVVFPPAVLYAALGLTALVIRYRRAAGDERQQIKWLGYAGVLYALQFLLTLIDNFTGGRVTGLTAVAAIVNVISVVAFPVAVGIGLLRYRLFDIDVVISRTLVYGALAVFITGVYVGFVVGLGSLLGGAGKPNLGLSILATTVVAVAFQPLRERLQHLANRLVYGHRASPYEVLSEFSRQAASSYAGEEALLRLAQVLAEGTGAEQAAVYLGDRQVAVYPPNADGAAGEERSLGVWHQGRLLGRLVVRKRRGETLTPLEEKLLADLANQAGLVLSNVGLTADLRSRLEELRASRQRLVRAQDEERRRLERNLHDGAQQHLVALKIRLGLAETLAAKDPEKLRPLLDDLQLEVDAALATMRDLAQGIYPPLLAERGLKEALEAQARRATVPVTIEAQGLGRYPQDVEAAVYFCCLEALQNVQKYARARSATVRIEQANGLLSFEVSDDGVGFDPGRASSGSGLTNLRDRLDALGGDLIVRSAPGAGTTLGGRVRLAPSRREAVGAEL